MAKLLHKLHITGTLTVETGLHIGGSEVELDIGGIDSEVIKIKQGDDRIPYIPGSSLKGKLRTLLGRKYGYEKVENDDKEVKLLFGKVGKGKHVPNTPARLIFRDNYATVLENKDEQQNKEVKYEFELEDKAENWIIRPTGEAKPRHLERVAKGSSFRIDIIMDVHSTFKKEEGKWKDDNVQQLLETLDMGFQLLQKDYLGGSGTRGYGKVSIEMDDIKVLDFKPTGEVDDTKTHDYTFKVTNTKA